jgi:PKD repeat protein
MKNYLTIIVVALFFYSCGKKGCTDPVAYNFNPNATKDDGSCFYGLDESSASFSFQVSPDNDNIIIFTADNDDVECSWDFGNGTFGSGLTDTAEYPFAGSYDVTLSVFNSQGNAQSTKTITIDQDDISLFDNPLHLIITGGTTGPGFRTWHIDSACTSHLGVGPPGGNNPDWWTSGDNEKPGCGIYDDRYTFYLSGYQYDMVTNGDVYIHNTLASSFPGSFENLYDFTAPFSDQLNESWDITEDSILSVTNSSFVGFYSGVNEYKITALTDTSMWLTYGHYDASLQWYIRLVPEGFVTNCP